MSTCNFKAYENIPYNCMHPTVWRKLTYGFNSQVSKMFDDTVMQLHWPIHVFCPCFCAHLIFQIGNLLYSYTWLTVDMNAMQLENCERGSECWGVWRSGWVCGQLLNHIAYINQWVNRCPEICLTLLFLYQQLIITNLSLFLLVFAQWKLGFKLLLLKLH